MFFSDRFQPYPCAKDFETAGYDKCDHRYRQRRNLHSRHYRLCLRKRNIQAAAERSYSRRCRKPRPNSSRSGTHGCNGNDIAQEGSRCPTQLWRTTSIRRHPLLSAVPVNPAFQLPGRDRKSSIERLRLRNLLRTVSEYPLDIIPPGVVSQQAGVSMPGRPGTIRNTFILPQDKWLQ